MPSLTASASIVTVTATQTVTPSATPAPATATPTTAPTVAVTSRPTTPPTPTVIPVPTPSPTPVVNPSQTRVPGSIPPTPKGLPATDGCLTYGATVGYVRFVDCVVHGLPAGAPVELTLNGVAVFLRIGATTVYPDGSWYFSWTETTHVSDTFVVTAGGVSRTITQLFN